MNSLCSQNIDVYKKSKTQNFDFKIDLKNDKNLNKLEIKREQRSSLMNYFSKNKKN